MIDLCFIFVFSWFNYISIDEYKSIYLTNSNLLIQSNDPVEQFITTEKDLFFMQLALREIISKESLVDKSELIYYFNQNKINEFSINNTKNDIDIIRTRYEKQKDCPNLNDSLRFHSIDYLEAQIKFNRRYKKYLGKLEEIDYTNREKIRDIMLETDNLYDIYVSLKIAKQENSYRIGTRKEAFKKFKDSISEQMYNEATLPPVVPIWHFREIK